MKFIAILAALAFVPVHSLWRSSQSSGPLQFLQTMHIDSDDDSEAADMAEDANAETGTDLGETETAINSTAEPGDPVGSDQATEPAEVEGALTLDEYEAAEFEENQQYLIDQDVLDPYSAQETAEEYVDRIHSMADFDSSLPVLASTGNEPPLVGDVTDNDVTDLEPLVLVAPAADSESMNPLERSFEYVYEEGTNYYDGTLQFILAGSMVEYTESAGKVWVFPVDNPSDGFQLVAGFFGVTGICFDPNHGFLYVIDAPHIYQFEVDWDGEDKFVLARNIYVDVFEGVWPTECKIDAFGNMIFIEPSNQVLKIDYIHLYKGNKDMQYSLYTYEEEVATLSFATALDVVDSETLYFLNYQDPDTDGLLLKADLTIEVVNGEPIEILLKSDFMGEGLAYTSNGRVYYALSSTSVWYYDLETEEDPVLVNADYFIIPRKMCYGSDKVYIADYGNGSVHSINVSDDNDAEPEAFVYLQGAFALSCINQA